MELTDSFLDVVPEDVRRCYDWRETRNAAKILDSTNSAEFGEIIEVLRDFHLLIDDITEPGGNKSTIATRLDAAFAELGWREGHYETTIRSCLVIQPYKAAGEKSIRIVETDVPSESYKIDNIKSRVALDVEWHAKDGNLDRDLGAYRTLYDSGIIDGAVIVTRAHDEIRALSIRLGRPDGFKTTTTTSLAKLEPRLTRGAAGGCPVLAIAITDRCLGS